MQSIEQTKNEQNIALSKRMRMYFQAKPNKEANMTKKVLFRMLILIGLLAVVALAVLAQTTTSARVGEDPMTAQRLVGSDYIERHPSKYYIGSDWIERHPTVVHGPDYYLGSDWIERHPSNYYEGSDWIERHPGGGLP